MAWVSLRWLLPVLCGAFAVILGPISSPSLGGASLWIANLLVGLALGALAVLVERRLSRAPFRLTAGAVIGFVAGAGVARVLLFPFPAGVGFRTSSVSIEIARPAVYLLLGLLGLLIGAQKGSRFRGDHFVEMFRADQEHRGYKILDTSVIIDGRIADISETGFLDGTLVIPQFVLQELQYVADSADPIKRNRGRKGLDILQRIKRIPKMNVIIPQTDFPSVRDVDQKLIELARQMGAKIITNDFNLAKVAQLRGVEVLSINELANSLRPVVRPGETMSVFILKEGKEPNQGVAYLDDGTMVVIDNASKQIGKNAQIIVTSVLQTTAGKMFFGRFASDFEKGPSRRSSRDRESRESRESRGPEMAADARDD